MGVRARLTMTLVGLVALTVAVLGAGTFAFVDASLRNQVRNDARQQAVFNLTVLVPSRLDPDAGPVEFERSGLVEAFKLRGDVEVIADFGDGNPYVSVGSLAGALGQLGGDLRPIIEQGELGYEWTQLAGVPVLVMAGRPPIGPDLYFVFSTATLEQALGQLRLGLVIGGLLAVLVGLAAASIVTRGILRPVHAASAAAERIGHGDLAARVPVTSGDEFGRWAVAFNRMAAALEYNVERLEDAESRNRRFVSDVAHELRTPLTALVAEASLIEARLHDLPPETRRTAELLVTDVRRLRILVDELMELSRFDAAAERIEAEPVDLARLVRSIVDARLPAAAVTVGPGRLVVESDPRRLDRIIGNLLDNAREHAGAAGVEVSVGREDDGIAVEVADRGPGIDPALLPRLFERFFKADPSRRAGSSGLGLAIAAEHAGLLGAQLSASNRVGGGMAFRLVLPPAPAVTGPLPDGDGGATGQIDHADIPDPLPRSRR
jgi:signal transduction histidine kinase